MRPTTSSGFGLKPNPYPYHNARRPSIDSLPFFSNGLSDVVKVVTAEEDADIYDERPIPPSHFVSTDASVFNQKPFSMPQYGSMPSPQPMLSPSPSEDALSMSPAARFLSSFSPASKPKPLPDAEGEVISGYTLGSVIGTGGFSTIRRASSSSGGVVAVKIVRHSDISKQDNSELVRKRLDHEATVWVTLCHEHILPLFSTIHTDHAEYFVTLYCPAGSLFDILKRDGRPGLLQEDVGMMFRQVVRGLRYLHETARIVHRDIKPENILVDEMGVCKIGDFGMAQWIGKPDEEQCSNDTQNESQQQQQDGDMEAIRRIPTTSARYPKTNLIPSSTSSPGLPPSPEVHTFQPGSLPYAAPELLRPRTSSTPVGPDPAQDVWALGVMLFFLLTGKLPFTDAFEPRLQMKILRGAYEIPRDIGHGAERVLRGCMEMSLSYRWTIATVDEVAWGVGAEGDDVTPLITEEEEEEEERNQSRLNTRSMSFSRCHPRANRGYQRDDYSPVRKPVSKRSSDHTNTSEPLAPALTNKSAPAKRSPSLTPMQPAYSALTEAIRRASSASSSSSSLGSSCSSDSTLSSSPSVGHIRRMEVPPLSRSSYSPSPTMSPSTPVPEASAQRLPEVKQEAKANAQLDGTLQVPPRSRRWTFGKGTRTVEAGSLGSRSGLSSGVVVIDDEGPSSETKAVPAPVNAANTNKNSEPVMVRSKWRRASDAGFPATHRPRTRRGSTPAPPCWTLKEDVEEHSSSGITGHDAPIRPERSAPISIPVKSGSRKKDIEF